MIITKVINNNVVSSLDNQNNEIVVMGRGVGFQKATGDEIDESLIEKIFSLTGQTTNQFKQLIESIPYEHIRVASEIISYAKRSLNKRLNDNIYVSLTDHLSYAITRQKSGVKFKNALLWEIKRFYNHEYLIGKEALGIVKKRLDIELSEDEAGFIALHIVNAELDTDMEQSLAMTKMIQDILNIVKYHFSITLDENSLAYERFLTHLKFFLQRAVSNQFYQTDDMEFCKMIQRQYKESYDCVLKIKEYMSSKLEYDISDEEITYLTIHIKRVISEQ